MRVIFDTDIGIDDALALLFLQASPLASLEAITTTFGNASVEATTRNALYVCETFGIHVPVHAGVATPLGETPLTGYADFVHGKNGLGDIPITAPSTIASTVPAAQAIVDLVTANPGEISIVAVGRLTNVAMALALEPRLPELTKQLVVMGGAFGFNGHTGNVSPVAEANIAGDPLAADIVFGAGFCLTIAGLDVTQEVIMDESYFQALREGSRAGQFIYDVSRFYLQFHKNTTGVFACPVHDSSAVAYFVAPELFVTQPARVRVATSGVAAGQTIQTDPDKSWALPHWSSVSVSNICIDVDATRFLSLFQETLEQI
ncbi:MAG: nucleoside hydrolase [Pseudomonadota bacterium]